MYHLTNVEAIILLLKLALAMENQPERNQNIYGVCGKSVTTMKEVSGCPRNLPEWRSRAEAMQCGSIQQNCTTQSEFVYHCLPNTHWNETFEVCAPRKLITLAYCAEFSVGGLRIQENYNHSCSGGLNPCPIVYYSNESYKYQQCYAEIKLLQKLIKKPVIPTSYTLQSSSNGSMDLFYTRKLIAFLTLLLFIILEQ